VKRKLPEETNVNILAGREEESSSRWREGKEEYKKKRGEERRGEERRERERERTREGSSQCGDYVSYYTIYTPCTRVVCASRHVVPALSALPRDDSTDR